MCLCQQLIHPVADAKAPPGVTGVRGSHRECGREMGLACPGGPCRNGGAIAALSRQFRQPVWKVPEGVLSGTGWATAHSLRPRAGFSCFQVWRGLWVAGVSVSTRMRPGGGLIRTHVTVRVRPFQGRGGLMRGLGVSDRSDAIQSGPECGSAVVRRW